MSGKHNRSKRKGSIQPRMKAFGESKKRREQASEYAIRQIHRDEYFKVKRKEPVST